MIAFLPSLIAQIPLPLPLPVSVPEKLPDTAPQLMIWIVCTLLVVMVYILYASIASRDKANTEDRATLKEMIQDARSQVASTRTDQIVSQDKFLTALEGVRGDFREQSHKSREMFAQTVDKVVHDGNDRLEKVCTTFAMGFKDLSDKVERHSFKSGG